VVTFIGVEPIGKGIYANRSKGIILVDQEEFDAFQGANEFLPMEEVARAVRHLFYYTFGRTVAVDQVLIFDRPVARRIFDGN
jgi:hypothetical protein